MKVEASRIDGFLKNPGSAPAALIFGKDPGLVAERGLALVRSVLGANDDVFRFVELHNPEPAALLAEATAACLTGGRRVVRVREASEALAKPMEALLRAPPDALVILEAGDLSAKSRLRGLLEKHGSAAAIACYAIDAEKLPFIITSRLRAAGITLGPDAAAWVARNIAPEEGPLRQAVEILCLYAGTATNLDLADVAAALADSGETSMQEAIDATISGDPAATDRALSLAYAEGVSPVGILRVLLGELLRLRLAAGSGLPPAAAVEAMRPPVFFRRKPVVARALSLWREAALTAAIRTALAAEAACKTTHIPDQAFCRQTMLGLALRAGAAARQ